MPPKSTLEALKEIVEKANESYTFLANFADGSLINKEDEYDNSADNVITSETLINNIKENLKALVDAGKNLSPLNDFEKEIVEEEFEKIYKRDEENHTDSLSFSKEDFDCPYIEDKISCSLDEFKELPKNIDKQYKYFSRGEFDVKHGKVTGENKEIPVEVKLARKEENINYGENTYFDYKFFDTSKLNIPLEKFKSRAIETGALGQNESYNPKDLDKKVRDYALILAFNEQLEKSSKELINSIKSCSESAKEFKKYIDSNQYYSMNGTLKNKSPFGELVNFTNDFLEQKPEETFGDLITTYQVKYKTNLFKKQHNERQLAEIEPRYNEELRKKQANKDYVVDKNIEKIYNNLINDKEKIKKAIDKIEKDLTDTCKKMDLNSYFNALPEAEMLNEMGDPDFKAKKLVKGLLLQAEHDFCLDSKEENNSLLDSITVSENEEEAIDKNTEFFTDRFFQGMDKTSFKKILNDNINKNNTRIDELKTEMADYKNLIDMFVNKNFTNINLYKSRKYEIEEGILNEEMSSAQSATNSLIDEEKQRKAEEYGLNGLNENNELKDEDFNKNIGRVVFGTKSIEERRKKANSNINAEQKKSEIENSYNLNNFQIRNYQLLNASLSSRQTRVANKFNEAVRSSVSDISRIGDEISETKKIISTFINRNNFTRKLDNGELSANVLYGNLFSSYKNTSENLFQLKDDIKKFKDSTLSFEQISEIANGTSKLPINEETLSRIKNSLEYSLADDNDKELIKGYELTQGIYRKEALEASNASVYFTASQDSDLYNEAIDFCSLDVSAKLVNSQILREKMDGLEEVINQNKFNLKGNDAKLFGNDENVGRLAINVGLLQGVTNLLNTLPQGDKYTNRDSGTYNDQITRLKDFKNKLRSHLIDAYPNNKTKEFTNILNHISNPNTCDKPINTYLLNDLFDKILLKKDGERRRDGFVKNVRNEFVEKNIKEQCSDLAKAYVLASNNVEDFRDFQRKRIDKLLEASKSHKNAKIEHENVSKQIEQNNLFQEYSDKYHKHMSQNFFKRIFDFAGRKELNQTRDSLYNKYGVSSSALDIIKYGNQITSSQLRSCIKKCINSKYDLHTIEKCMFENALFTDKKVMDDYVAFCEKGKFNPSTQLIVSAERAKEKEKTINQNDKKIIDKNNAAKKEKEANKHNNKNKENIKEEKKVVIANEHNENVNSSELIKNIKSNFENDNELINDNDNLRSKTLVSLNNKKPLVLDSENQLNNVGVSNNKKEYNNELVNEKTNQL